MKRWILLGALFLPSALAAQTPVPVAEHLSPYGLPKPVLVIAGELPKDFENKDGAAIADALKDDAPAGFQFLKTPADQPRPGLVGLYVPPDAVFQIKKRVLSNVGKGTVTLRLAKSAAREGRAVELSGRKTADYNELRRAASDRAADNVYPPKELPVPAVPKGTLVIIGGGGMTPDISQRFFDAGGGAEGRFVILPISAPDPIRETAERSFLTRLGAKNVVVVPHREQKDLEDPKVLELFEKATGVWFGGGRQWNFVDAYEGTRVAPLIRAVLDRDGVIGGSSAGATIQGDYLVRGAPAGPNIMMCEGYERAMGFLPGVAIDQHFSARNRFRDMTALVAAYPQFLGIGLDESTAIVVRGSTAEILGRGKVHFYDRRKPVPAEGPDYDAYPAGVKYDLAKRAKIEATTPDPAK
jgi:cyanophycinase